MDILDVDQFLLLGVSDHDQLAIRLILKPKSDFIEDSFALVIDAGAFVVIRELTLAEQRLAHYRYRGRRRGLYRNRRIAAGREPPNISDIEGHVERARLGTGGVKRGCGSP